MFCKRNNFNSGRVADNTVRGDGLMADTLEDKIIERNGFVIVAHNGTNLVGWAIVYTDFNTEYQCYTLVRYRRKGVATAMLKKAFIVSKKKRLSVFEHSGNQSFFNKAGVTRNGNVTDKILKKKRKAM
jgi:hypothetical protein